MRHLCSETATENLLIKDTIMLVETGNENWV